MCASVVVRYFLRLPAAVALTVTMRIGTDSALLLAALLAAPLQRAAPAPEAAPVTDLDPSAGRPCCGALPPPLAVAAAGITLP